MTDRALPPPASPDPGKTVPEAAPEAEPRFDEPSRPAPEVVDTPERNTEF